MCDGCQKKVTGYAASAVIARDNAKGMAWYDWLTFVMIGGMIALIVWSECEDIKVAGARLWSLRMPLRSPRQILRMFLFLVDRASLPYRAASAAQRAHNGPQRGRRRQVAVPQHGGDSLLTLTLTLTHHQD